MVSGCGLDCNSKPIGVSVGEPVVSGWGLVYNSKPIGAAVDEPVVGGCGLVYNSKPIGASVGEPVVSGWGLVYNSNPIGASVGEPVVGGCGLVYNSKPIGASVENRWWVAAGWFTIRSQSMSRQVAGGQRSNLVRAGPDNSKPIGVQQNEAIPAEPPAGEGAYTKRTRRVKGKAASPREGSCSVAIGVGENGVKKRSHFAWDRRRCAPGAYRLFPATQYNAIWAPRERLLVNYRKDAVDSLKIDANRFGPWFMRVTCDARCAGSAAAKTSLSRLTPRGKTRYVGMQHCFSFGQIGRRRRWRARDSRTLNGESERPGRRRLGHPVCRTVRRVRTALRRTPYPGGKCTSPRCQQTVKMNRRIRGRLPFPIGAGFAHALPIVRLGENGHLVSTQARVTCAFKDTG